MRKNNALQMPKVSVVVPIYKVEKYLRECVDSILAQTLTDIEVILVDDGSPDACPKIVDEYATKDARVVPVHQPNGGYGNAVNHGVRLARGEYVGIIESDDWIEPTMYEKLYTAAKKNDADLAKCNFFVYNSAMPVGSRDAPWRPREQDLREAPDGAFNPVRDYPQIFHFHSSLWSNLYRRDFLKKIPILETKGAAYQDFPFIMEVLSRAERMVAVKEELVHYRMETGQNSSTMGDVGGAKWLRMAEMSIVARNVLSRLGTLERVKENFYYHALIANFIHVVNSSGETREKYFSLLRECFALLKKDRNFTFKYFAPHDKALLQDILAGNSSKSFLKFFHARKRNYFRLNIRRERIIVKLGAFERVIPLRRKTDRR